MRIPVFVSSMILVSSVSFASGGQCVDLFELTSKTELNATIESNWLSKKDYNLTVKQKKIINRFNDFYAKANSKYVISKDLAIKLLKNTEYPWYGQILNQLSLYLEKSDIKNDDVFEAGLRHVLKKNKYTENIIENKIQELKSNGTKKWMSILGDLKLDETHEMFYGKSLDHINENSLLGQYLKKTGASTKIVKFPEIYLGQATGPEKLVVSVSEKSFETFRKLFLSNTHYMTVVGHANVLHANKFYSFGGQKSDIRAPGVNTPMPMLLLKTTEAQRLNRYMELTTDSRYNEWYTENKLKKPWYLENYCARGGYECCTHWLGNIPIGDKRVSEYSFPPGDYNQANGPQAQELKHYEVGAEDEVLKSVWKAPGFQQLSHVIGQKQSNDVGEMASPGYVIHTLLGPTTNERVPVVFLMRNDHKEQLGEITEADLNFERPR